MFSFSLQGLHKLETILIHEEKKKKESFLMSFSNLLTSIQAAQQTGAFPSTRWKS